MARSWRLTRILYYGAVFILLACAYRLMVNRSTSKIDRPGSNINAISKTKAASYSAPKIPRKELSAAKSQQPESKSDVVKRISPLKQTEAQNHVCAQPWKTDWDAIENGRKPAITLDTARFLHPLLVNGPNNQLIGMRDAVYLAIRLNRTLILPRFYKHKTDTTIANRSSSFIPPSQRIDVASLARLIRVLSFSAVHHTCTDGFDDLYFTSYKGMHSSLTHVVDDIGVPIHTKISGEPANVYPLDADPSSNALFPVHSDKSYLRKLYGSPGKCSLYVGPFRSVGVKESAGMLRKTRKKYLNENGTLEPLSINPDVIPDEELYSLIVHSTPQPKHIFAIVNDFMTEYGLDESPYVSVHWRYDPIDWQIRCRKDRKNSERNKDFLNEMCDKIEHTEPIDVSRAILKFVRRIELVSTTRIKIVYFAAPLNMQKFIEGVEIEMEAVLEEEGLVDELKVFTQTNLRDHLEKYTLCQGLKENFEDIFSQLEMDVCSRATAFLRSPSSSWSKVIKEKRVINSLDKNDANIFDLAWKAAEKRLNE